MPLILDICCALQYSPRRQFAASLEKNALSPIRLRPQPAGLPGPGAAPGRQLHNGMNNRDAVLDAWREISFIHDIVIYKNR